MEIKHIYIIQFYINLYQHLTKTRCEKHIRKTQVAKSLTLSI